MRSYLVALNAIKRTAEELRPALFALYPRAVLPGRVMTDVPRMPAFQVGYPVVFLVFVKSDNTTFHGRTRS